jgi:N-ethylmaleimide reductase
MEKIFQPFKIADIKLSNRIVMAPLTRRRATNEFLAPDETIALYYAQRASAGLIVSEGSQISPQGYGYTGSPGCYSEQQIAGWKKVTKAVHKKGGKIFLQLWHVGPYSHPLLQPNGQLPVSASDVKPEGEVLTQEGHKNYVAPKPMTETEIFQTIDDFGQAAKNAKEAGFDGVEIHGAHGYIIDQFIKDGTNKRKDDFGGSVENRAKFLFLVLEKVIEAWSADRVGIRLSPGIVRPDAVESNPEKTYGYVVEKLNDYPIAFLHLSEMIPAKVRSNQAEKLILPFYRNLYKGNLISCGGYTRETAIQTIDKGEADLIAFGKAFISNPDLVERLIQKAPLTLPDKDTFYHGGKKGYVDYPSLSD